MSTPAKKEEAEEKNSWSNRSAETSGSRLVSIQETIAKSPAPEREIRHLDLSCAAFLFVGNRQKCGFIAAHLSSNERVTPKHPDVNPIHVNHDSARSRNLPECHCGLLKLIVELLAGSKGVSC